MKTKYQKGRIEIIDRELSKKEWVKTNELKKIIKNELRINVDIRTIQKDLELMESDPPIGYGAPIKKDTKHKAYCYSDPTFTIRALGLREQDINALLFYSKTINQFHGSKIFEDISKAVEKVLDNFKIRKGLKGLIKSKVIVQSEIIPPIKGHEFIYTITQAQEAKKRLKFKYAPYGGTIKERIVSPYLLKEDKHLWYLIGVIEGKEFPTTFALDRMTDLEITEDNFTPQDFNSDEYFKHSFGITVLTEAPIEVILSFSPEQGNYVKALPIHNTQTLISDTEEEYKISVLVKPSYEFYSKILSYGNSVTVISPKSVIEKVKEKLKTAIDNYMIILLIYSVLS